MPQAFHKLYYHMVWGTKNREPLITPKVEDLLKEIIPQKIKELEGFLIALNMIEEHLHLSSTIPPKISVTDFVSRIKGSSSHYINVATGERSFYWQVGYGVLSLSEKGIPFVKKYINDQKIRHKNNDLIDVLEHVPEEKTL